ncbi:hypothetical protein WR25_23291 [Diploscapter pachys]|uniref:Uncharacterized protein n=1 Tax=Diploscapter pachys TaxID=2018661 RepID=A0A2A2J7Q0_9BILA|nr:hypothetical protein WR25_23291 [Diploscapter pachys]
MDSKDEYSLGKVFASLPRTTRGLPTVLGNSPDGTKLLYCNGNSVFIVNMNDVTDVDIYTEHPISTTVAKMSPSGYYCASGDSHGNIRLWDTTQKTHILKATYQVFSGPVRDIAWNDDSKRIAAVGEGKERFGHVFLFDTGTSNGNLSGQSRPMSSIDFRPTRPFRLISGSEDNTVAMFEGPPFKFKTTFHDHSRFVNVTRYNPDGSLFASAGADGKVILFEGTEGTKQGELVDDACNGNAHAGSVFGMCWSPCGAKIATASGDKKIKIWNVASKSLEKTIDMGQSVDDQQLSILWTKAALVSISLAGFINVIDPELGQLKKAVHGHNKPITALTLSTDKQWLYTADFEGHLTRWNVQNGESKRIQPQIHKSQIIGLASVNPDTLISAGWDDTVQFTANLKDSIESARPTSVALPSQPLGLAASEDGTVTVVSCHKHITVFENGKQSSELASGFPGSCAAINKAKSLVAVGGQDSKVHIYSLSGGKLTEKKVLPHSGHITAIAFSPNDEFLVATDSARKVIPYAVNKDFANASDKEWTFHTAKVNCVAWSPNSRHLATGSLDTNIMVWDMQKTGEHPLVIKGAHAMSPVNALVWISENHVVSAGQDANLKHWHLKL